MPLSASRVRTSGIVEGGGGEAGVDVAGVAAAGAAVERGGVGVVGAVAAVAADQDEAGEVLRQAHVAQRALRERGAIGGGRSSDFAASARGRPAVLAAGSDQLAPKARPSGFDEGEAGGRGVLERLPRTLLAPLPGGVGRRGFAAVDRRDEQHRAARRGLAGVGRLVRHGKPEEAGEAERVGAGQRGLQVPPGDSERTSMQKTACAAGRAGWQRGGLRGEIGGELLLVAGLVGGLPAGERLVELADSVTGAFWCRQAGGDLRVVARRRACRAAS